MLHYLPYSGKIWRGLKFGDLVSSLKLVKFNSSPNFLPFYTLLAAIALFLDVLFVMALHKYLKKIEPEDKRKSGEDSSSLSRKDGEMAGREVWRILEESATVARQRSVPQGRRGKYNCYSPEERASIGKYAAENGATQAAKHFSRMLGQTVNESFVEA